MAYKWKPNRAQKDAYIKHLQEKESYNTYTTPYTIREGCFVKYYNVSRGEVISGIVTNDSYGEKTKQHTFTIDGVRVKGRNLYPNVIEHRQGENSKNENYDI
jgi:hypothetical protein